MTQKNSIQKTININQFELFLFDMDGTLVNTEPLHAKAMDIVLNKNSINISICTEEALERFKGMTDTLVLKTLCPTLTDTNRDQLIAEKNTALKEIFRNLNQAELTTLTAPGIRELLIYLHSQGKKLAVVSASENEIVHETLTSFKLLNQFDFWFGRGSTMRTKPFPDPYTEAMKRVNITKENTVIFEDSPTGLTAAYAAGATVVEVAPFGKEDYLKDYRKLLLKS